MISARCKSSAIPVQLPSGAELVQRCNPRIYTRVCTCTCTPSPAPGLVQKTISSETERKIMTPTEMLIKLDRLLTERTEITKQIDALRTKILQTSGPVPDQLPNGKTWRVLTRRYAAITDRDGIPTRYCTAPDLKKIKRAIDAGVDIPGAELRESSCYQFKAAPEGWEDGL